MGLIENLLADSAWCLILFTSRCEIIVTVVEIRKMAKNNTIRRD